MFPHTHLISPASAFLRCIPPLLQDFHFQLLYKLLLILIQPNLLQLRKIKDIVTENPSLQLHFVCLCETQDSLKESVVVCGGGAAVMTTCQERAGIHVCFCVCYLDFWSRYQQHDVPRVFA